jgi:hypothetical protein
MKKVEKALDAKIVSLSTKTFTLRYVARLNNTAERNWKRISRRPRKTGKRHCPQVDSDSGLILGSMGR